MADAKLVSTGKPKIGGAIFTAPLGTAVPTDATAALAAAYKGLGFVSEDGLVNSNTPESDNIVAWGGDVVMTVSTSKADTYSYTLIESLNVDVLKAVYGASNVTGTLDDMVTIKHNNNPQAAMVWVIDMIMANGFLKRIVIPSGTVSEVGDITYVDGEAVGYETTVAAMPDADGNTSYEYIQAAPAAGG